MRLKILQSADEDEMDSEIGRENVAVQLILRVPCPLIPILVN